MANNVTVESVWDYPRPPRLEASHRHLRILHQGVVVADTTHSVRVLETSHPPVFYLPPADVAIQYLQPSRRRSSFCEFKGYAAYWSLVLNGHIAHDVAWSYSQPTTPYAPLKDCLAFYASRVDECWVEGERVQPQPGDFYGGWITSHGRGPFKGAPGTLGW